MLQQYMQLEESRASRCAEQTQTCPLTASQDYTAEWAQIVAPLALMCCIVDIV